MIESDPIFGDVVANYPSDRGRLLLIGGGIYAVVAFVVNVAFLPVDAQTASVAVIMAMAITALVVGWWVLHLWNREIVLYARGFSYTEGSRTIFIRFDEITSIHQRAERRSYFGGLLRRTFREATIKTVHDEKIVLNSFYRRLDDFVLRLEQVVTPHLRLRAERQLNDGHEVPFGTNLILKKEGVVVDGQSLTWTDYTGFHVKEGKLVIEGRDLQLTTPLAALDNLKLLLDTLNAKKKPL